MVAGCARTWGGGTDEFYSSMAAILIRGAALRVIALVLGATVQAVSSSIQVVSSGGDIDATWRAWLESPPPASVAAAANLTARADVVAASVGTSPRVSGSVDVVVSGGGNYDAYFMGASMIFARASLLHQLRFAGASAGGMMPFELALKGELITLTTHLAYGLLEEQYPLHFKSELVAGELQDHHWRIMAAWQAQKWNRSLSSLDGRVLLATSCLDPLPKLVLASNFSSIERATHAFMATGTVFEWYDGMACSDGGATSGPKMTPLFHGSDGRSTRPQIIVDLMQSGGPSSMIFKYNVSQFIALAQRGQDEAAEFLRTGTVARAQAVTLCPTGATTAKNLCEQSAMVES